MDNLFHCPCNKVFSNPISVYQHRRQCKKLPPEYQATQRSEDIMQDIENVENSEEEDFLYEPGDQIVKDKLPNDCLGKYLNDYLLVWD